MPALVLGVPAHRWWLEISWDYTWSLGDQLTWRKCPLWKVNSVTLCLIEAYILLKLHLSQTLSLQISKCFSSQSRQSYLVSWLLSVVLAVWLPLNNSKYTGFFLFRKIVCWLCSVLLEILLPASLLKAEKSKNVLSSRFEDIHSWICPRIATWGGSFSFLFFFPCVSYSW